MPPEVSEQTAPGSPPLDPGGGAGPVVVAAAESKPPDPLPLLRRHSPPRTLRAADGSRGVERAVPLVAQVSTHSGADRNNSKVLVTVMEAMGLDDTSI